MLAEQVQAEDLSADALMQRRISFAERCFTNVQDLSRFMDVKAGYLLSAVALLTSALAIVGAGAFGRPLQTGWRAWLPGVTGLFFIGYIITAVATIYKSVMVFRARGGSGAPEDTAPGLIFPLTLLKRYCGEPQSGGDELRYYARLRSLSSHEILHDFASQIVEVSAIYDRKQCEINRGVSLFIVLIISWIITMLLFLTIIINI